MKPKEICLIILMGLLQGGCLAGTTLTRPDPQITIFDVQLAYPMMDYHTNELVISSTETIKLREFYGQDIFKAGETLVYYTVDPLKHRGRALQVLGGVIEIDKEDIGIMVGLRKGVIKDVILRKGDIKKAPPGLEEFLSQFKGRGMNSSFELITRPEDLLSLHSKLRPIPGYYEASNRIADLLRKIVIIAGVLKL